MREEHIDLILSSFFFPSFSTARRMAPRETPRDCSSVSSGSHSLLHEVGIIEPDFEFDEEGLDDLFGPQNPMDPLNIRNPNPDPVLQQTTHEPFEALIEELRLENRNDPEAFTKWIKWEGFPDDEIEFMWAQPWNGFSETERLILQASADNPENRVLRAARYNILRIGAPGLESIFRRTLVETLGDIEALNPGWKSLRGVPDDQLDDQLEELIKKAIQMGGPKVQYSQQAQEILSFYYGHPTDRSFMVAAYNILTSDVYILH